MARSLLRKIYWSKCLIDHFGNSLMAESAVSDQLLADSGVPVSMYKNQGSCRQIGFNLGTGAGSSAFSHTCESHLVPVILLKPLHRSAVDRLATQAEIGLSFKLLYDCIFCSWYCFWPRHCNDSVENRAHQGPSVFIQKRNKEPRGSISFFKQQKCHSRCFRALSFRSDHLIKNLRV